MPLSLLETFPALDAIPGLIHGFVLRHPDVDVRTNRDTALARLQQHFAETLQQGLGISYDQTWFGEQVHGCEIAECDGSLDPQTWADTDGLITATPGEFLGIYVADCCAVYLIDPIQRACGLVHSGKKGTELGIAARAISEMRERYGSQPSDIIVQLSPCIRPPAYEIDFAADIRKDCASAGIPENQIHDPVTCTSHDLNRYYSYRTESGQTGRHLAILGWSN